MLKNSPPGGPVHSVSDVRMTAEGRRLDESRRRVKHWNRWGPYLAERARGTVREDYSRDATPWEYFPHDHARSRAYRWNEDGLLAGRRPEYLVPLDLSKAVRRSQTAVHGKPTVSVPEVRQVE